jgi:uncharacterized protein YndB with AHSA1/START domain
MTDLSKYTLTLTRMLDAPRELVFKAWTDPKHLQRWWGPKGSDNGETRLDLRPGGRIFIQMRGPGFDHPMGGAFREIDPPRRLVFTSTAFEDGAGDMKLENLNTITFEDIGGKTRMTVHVVVLRASADMMPALDGMKEGWSGSLDRLTELLTTL